MHDTNLILAEVPGLGRIRLCECKSIHVSIGPVTINLEPAAFRQMAELVASATEQLATIKESRDDGRKPIRMFRPIQSRMTN